MRPYATDGVAFERKVAVNYLENDLGRAVSSGNKARLGVVKRCLAPVVSAEFGPAWGSGSLIDQLVRLRRVAVRMVRSR